MKLFYKYIAAVFIIAALFSACHEDPASVGSGLIPDRDHIVIDEIDSYNDSLQQTSGYFKKNITLGTASRIILGNIGGLESSVLLRFYITLPDSVKDPLVNSNLNIVKAWIDMKPAYFVGDSSGVFDFSVHKINDTWSIENGFTADSLADFNYFSADMSFNKSITDTLVSYEIDKSVARDWLELKADDSRADNDGIYLKPTSNTTRAMGFQAFVLANVESQPSLNIIVEDPGNFTDTISAVTNEDIHVIQGNLSTNNSTDIYLQGGVSYRGELKFDLSNLPEDVVLTKATLEMYVDSLETIDSSPVTDNLNLYLFDSRADTTVRSDLGVIQLRRDGNTFSGDVTNLVQRIFSGVDNEGFQINLSGENVSFAKIAIKGSNDPDPLARPRLKLYYITKEQK